MKVLCKICNTYLEKMFKPKNLHNRCWMILSRRNIESQLREKVILKNKPPERFYLEEREIYMRQEFILLVKKLSLKINGAISHNQPKSKKMEVSI